MERVKVYKSIIVWQTKVKQKAEGKDKQLTVGKIMSTLCDHLDDVDVYGLSLDTP